LFRVRDFQKGKESIAPLLNRETLTYLSPARPLRVVIK